MYFISPHNQFLGLPLTTIAIKLSLTTDFLLIRTPKAVKRKILQALSNRFKLFHLRQQTLFLCRTYIDKTRTAADTIGKSYAATRTVYNSGRHTQLDCPVHITP